MSGDGPAASLREAVERLAAAGRLAEIRAPVADAAEALRVARAVDFRRAQASRIAAGPGGRPAVAAVYADRARLAAVLGGPADGLPGWLGGRLERPVDPRPVAAADAPLLATRDAAAPDAGGGLGALLVVAQPGSAAPLLALVTAGRDTEAAWRIGPLPWRLRKAAAAAAQQGASAALVFGAPPAALVAAALAGGAAGDALAQAGGILGAGLACVLPSNDSPPLPAEAEMAVHGALAGDGDALRLVPGGVVARTAPVLHLMGRPDTATELLALEALAAETVLARHVATVEGGVDVIDVVVFPETANRVAALKIRPRIGGQSKTALMAALSSPHLAPEIAIGVDEDVDVRDLRDIVWSMASRLHGEIDVATIGNMAMGAVDRAPAAAVRAGTKWFVDSTMPPLTQAEKRAGFARAIPKNLASVRLEDFLPD
ncbi:MAG: UbiD family decarboxylase [Alphaproteobacteria bacterium]